MSPSIKTAIQWGLIAGLCMAIFRFLIYLISPLSITTWENAYYVPLLFCMVWGVVTVKRSNNGYITFGQAFLITFLIALTGVIINTAFGFALIKWIDPGLGEKIYRLGMEKAEEQWEKANLSEDQIKMMKDRAEWFFKSPVLLLLMFVWQIVIGSIIALIISAFVRRPDSIVPNPVDSNPAN